MKLENVSNELRSSIQKNGYLSVDIRRKKLIALKKAIVAKEESINKALKDDLGKSSFESYTTEVGFILEEISYILKNLSAWTKVQKVKTPLALFPGKSSIFPEPYGVVLIISPWNYPFQLCLSPLIGALAAGNRVVIKPSEYAPRTSKVIKELIEEVFQESEVMVIEGALEETQTLLRQRFDYIFFTGSTAVGKVVMQLASAYLTPVTLELGGKSPCLIEESANLDVAARRCAWGKFLNAGQTCVAPDYVVVPRKLQNQFIERLKVHLEIFYGKQPENSQDYPRIINEKHFDRLTALIVPDKVAIGGHFNREQKFIAPTIMKDVSWDDKIMQEEIFGPILPVIPYDHTEQVMEDILALPKPLAFYIFSESTKMKNEIIARIPFGGGCINDTVIHLANPALPFGGVGTSGIGSYHGKKSFDTFTHFKSVFEQSTRVDIPLRYPPSEGKLRWIKLFLR